MPIPRGQSDSPPRGARLREPPTGRDALRPVDLLDPNHPPGADRADLRRVPRRPERVRVGHQVRARRRVTRIEMRTVFPTQDLRDETLKKCHRPSVASNVTVPMFSCDHSQQTVRHHWTCCGPAFGGRRVLTLSWIWRSTRCMSRLPGFVAVRTLGRAESYAFSPDRPRTVRLLCVRGCDRTRIAERSVADAGR